MNGSEVIIIAAGGTGGHLYPGVALARELRRRGKTPVFIVRCNDAGREILEKEGFGFEEIPVAGMPRRLSLRLFTFAFLQVRSFFAVRRLFRRLRPSVVIGMGGYISFPAVVMARCNGIPTAIHEQNYIPGLANKVLMRIATRVALSFEESLRFFPRNKTVVTGNPVRAELFGASGRDVYRAFNLSPEKFTVLVFGGSQGASVINRTLVQAFPLLAPVKDTVQFLHITGKRDAADMERQYADGGISGRVLPYLHEIGDAYRAADLIVCRSGATTVAELRILNKPSVLIPYLHATANHQEFNAMVLVKAGTAVLIREPELTPELLAEAILSRVRTFTGHAPAGSVPPVLPQAALADLLLQLSAKF
jgi:UDP-N-acetylglucosamine--N-acetylmuramyl-(pentapeptide) pyrophosphoryl-undecaprenol N-acetylglucosamine transferase